MHLQETRKEGKWITSLGWKLHSNKQIIHAFLFIIKNYSPKIINICGVEYYITEDE